MKQYKFLFLEAGLRKTYLRVMQQINQNKKIKRLLIASSFITTPCHTIALKLSEPRYEGSLNTQFLSKLKETFNSHHFIETGTFGGVTTIRAAQIFSEAHTIELFEPFYQRNLQKFSAYANIHSYFGESPIIINKILPLISHENCLFFLDAHYSGPGTARANENTPILAEIQAIGTHTTSGVILIDDLRCFQIQQKINEQLSYNPQETTLEGYPSLTQLKQEALKINKDYEFVVYGDIALLYPKDKYPLLEISPVLKAMSMSRLFEEIASPSSTDLEQVLISETIIMHAQGEEKEAIQKLLDPLEGRQIPALYTTHYKLWNALILMQENEYLKALALFTEAYNLGLNHPRIQQYITLTQDKLKKE